MRLIDTLELTEDISTDILEELKGRTKRDDSRFCKTHTDAVGLATGSTETQN